MPTKHIVKVYVANHYYHVFNRGWNLSKIFTDEKDFLFFEHLLARHLGSEVVANATSKPYKNYLDVVQLNAYCLMSNHFHLLLYQTTESGVRELMTSILTAYTMYFNRRHGRRGPLFESTFKAGIVLDDAQLMHITRYIHLNHNKFTSWSHRSYKDYMVNTREWIKPNPILELFGDTIAYETFVNDYADLQRERDDIKHELFGRSA